MRRLRVTVLDLVTNTRAAQPFARAMNPNRASIMPQVVAVWCEQAGHDVRFLCYTGLEDLGGELAGSTDLLFIGAFTRSAQLAYAISSLYRSRGAVTVLGGPHARSYPQDAARYFDYVLGFTDRALVGEVLADCSPHRPAGVQLAAKAQPKELPGVRERWKFIEPTIAKARGLKIVPMLGSVGCPYTCDFCIDATIDYQPFPTAQIQEDLRFLRTQMARPFVGWHDPNFGVRFDDYLDAIEDAVPPGSVRFAAESSLSLLSEPNLRRLQKNGFVAILPGIESWYTHGNKSKTGTSTGEAKVARIAEHVNTILRHIPYVQTNFVLGLDCDHGPEPFELTKKFMDLAPGAFPAFSLLTCYGQGSPLNLDLQRAGRVLPFPFHFLNSSQAMNVRPKNYTWREFYDQVISLTRHSLAPPKLLRRFRANRGLGTKWLNLLRGISSKKRRYYADVRGHLEADPAFAMYFEGRTRALPEFFARRLRRDLGDFLPLLPEGALDHDPNAGMSAGAPPPAATAAAG